MNTPHLVGLYRQHGALVLLPLFHILQRGAQARRHSGRVFLVELQLLIQVLLFPIQLFEPLLSLILQLFHLQQCFTACCIMCRSVRVTRQQCGITAALLLLPLLGQLLIAFLFTALGHLGFGERGAHSAALYP